ncbi:MAG: ABC transporter ATP-binding protein [Desulfobacteraceae bacterium]|nr:ABC transporter ATP-binding protein [Desulfobacteraceae bacterium]
MTWLAGLALNYRKAMSLLLLLQLCHAALISVIPVFFQKIVSLALTDVTTFLLPSGLRLLGFLAMAFLLTAIFQSCSGYIACLFSSDLLKQLQLEFFEKISHLPLSYFQHQSAGEFMTKFNHDIGLVQGFVAGSLPMVLREIITILFAMVILFFSCSAFLMIVSLGMVVLVSFLIMKLNRVLKKYALKQRAGWGRINKVFDETIQGIDTIKTFAGEEQVRQHFKEQTGLLRKLSVKAGITTAVFSPLIDLMSKLGGLVLVLIAYCLIIRESLLTDRFLLFFFYAGLLQASVSSLVQGLSNIQPQLVSAGNIASFFSEKSEVLNDSPGSAILEKPCFIRAKGLYFSYPGGRSLFKDAGFEAPENRITLIQGPSGSGKSTLINLLLGFYLPSKGKIFFGPDPIENFSRKELREKISVATQYHYIFHDTLKRNLSIASPDATDDEMIRALERAHLGEFLSRLPQGINAVMDPRGKGISGGEKQRISMARILLRKSPVIILDEPWSNLDENGRDILIRVVNRCRLDSTILVLTHDIPPGLETDRVYHLMPGQGEFKQVK